MEVEVQEGNVEDVEDGEDGEVGEDRNKAVRLHMATSVFQA